MGTLLAFLMARSALALEVDSFVGRDETIADSAAILNTEMNARISKAVSHANSVYSRASKRCRPWKEYDHPKGGYPQDLYWPLHTSLAESNALKPWNDEDLTEWAEDNSEVAKILGMPADSIYRSISFQEVPLFYGATTWPFNGLSSLLKVNGVLIGADKLTHFADQGFVLFNRHRNMGQSLQQAFDNVSDEDGIWGEDSSGVYSYGDLAANASGMDFWDDLFFGDRAIVSCGPNGRFEVARPFEIRDYVFGAWDEALNCSKYSEGTPSVRASVETRLAELGMTCPLAATDCVGMRAEAERRWGVTGRDGVVNPACAAAKREGGTGEHACEAGASPGTGAEGTVQRARAQANEIATQVPRR